MQSGDGAAVVALWKNYLPNTEDWDAWLPGLLNDLIEERVVWAAWFSPMVRTRAVLRRVLPAFCQVAPLMILWRDLNLI